jgi:hypothetical protein
VGYISIFRHSHIEFNGNVVFFPGRENHTFERDLLMIEQSSVEITMWDLLAG